jgi:hypothetical protein
MSSAFLDPMEHHTLHAENIERAAQHEVGADSVRPAVSLPR